jgi:branched-chain amino acid transport system permease protein
MVWLWLEAAKNGLFQGSIIALMAIAFAWVYRTTRTFHVAVGVSFLAGGYTAFYVRELLAAPIVVCWITGATSGVILNGLVHLLVYRQLQLREASNSLRLIASLGVYFLFSGLAALLFGNDIKNAEIISGWSGKLGGVIITASDCQYIGAAVILGCVLALSLRFWALGRGLRGVASNPKLYMALGRNDARVTLLATGASGFLAGLCGSFEALRNGIEPYSGLPVAISAAVATILGGRSLFFGPVAAAVFLGLARSATTHLASDRWADFLVYGLLLVIITLGPKSLIGPAVEEERP